VGVVDIWRADLALAGDVVAQLLSPAERERAGGIADERRRALWMRGRGVLRVLLGSYLERAPHRIELATGAQGKPELATGAAGAAVEPTLSFNLSHSGTWALYAFTKSVPVGVDLEVPRGRTIDHAALAERVFGPREAQRLGALPSSFAREREFLRLWVVHEARLKCLGLALTGAAKAQANAATRLWIAELDLGPEMAAAVAVQGAAQELRLWDYEG
jgi:4'-phosphopantetheinyl transferase